MGRRLACVALLILAVASVVDARQLQEQPAEQYVGVKRASALAAEGGAAVYLQRLSTKQPNRLKRILRRSHVEESALPALAKMLDEDDDLVSIRAMLHVVLHGRAGLCNSITIELNGKCILTQAGSCRLCGGAPFETVLLSVS